MKTLSQFKDSRSQAQQKRRRREEFFWNMASGASLGATGGGLLGLGRTGSPVKYGIGGALVGAGLGNYYTRKQYKNRKKETNPIAKYTNNKLYGK